jgi:hypothetical protein
MPLENREWADHHQFELAEDWQFIRNERSRISIG